MLKNTLNIEDKIIFEEPMNKHTSFKIGGAADLFIKINTEEELIQSIKYAKDGLFFLALSKSIRLAL